MNEIKTLQAESTKNVEDLFVQEYDECVKKWAQRFLQFDKEIDGMQTSLMVL